MLSLALALTYTLCTYGGRLSPKEKAAKNGLTSFFLAETPTLRPQHAKGGAPTRTRSPVMDETMFQKAWTEDGFDTRPLAEEGKNFPYQSEVGWAKVLDMEYQQSYNLNPRYSKAGGKYGYETPSLLDSPAAVLDSFFSGAKRIAKDPGEYYFPSISKDTSGTRSWGKDGSEVMSRTIKPPTVGGVQYTDRGLNGYGLFGFGDLNNERPPSDSVKLLAQTEKLGLLSLLYDKSLLSQAEGKGVFSSLEASGALSTAEKLLPVVERLGLLSTAQGLIDEDPGFLAAVGALLVGLAPIYAALDLAGVLPDPGVLGVVGGLTTTAAGAALLALTNAITTLQSGDNPSGDREIKLLSQLEKLGVLSTVAEKGLLSKAEESGVLSSLESAGAFSTIEKTLPTVERLGLLSVAQGLIDNDPSALSTSGALLAILAPAYAALDVAGIVPDPGLLPLALGGLVTTAAGVALLTVASAINTLQSDA